MNETLASKCYIKVAGGFQILYLGTLLGFIVLILNLLIIVTILRTKTLHTNTNIFILSVGLLDCLMAIADFTQGLVYSTTIKYDMQDNNYIDAFYLGAGYGAATLSCTHLAIIAIDRYITIAHPFYYIVNITKRRLITVLLIAWLFGLVYCTAPLIFYRDRKYYRHCITAHPPVEYFIINASLNLSGYVIICICYFKIAHLAFKHKKAANARRLQTESAENIIKLRNNRTAAMKSVKFFICLFGTFFVCTFPQVIATTLVLSSYNIPDKLLVCIFYLFDIHSIMNFVIYLHLNKDFSRGLKQLFFDMITFCRVRCVHCKDKF